MPPEERLPLCPAAVVTAKPRRERWALEEAWDLAVLLGGEARETGYPGVIVVVAPRRPGPGEALPRMAFIARITVPARCVRPLDRGALLEALRGAPGRARVIYALRGETKQEWVKHVVESVVRHDRRSQQVLVLEGLGDTLIVSWGPRRSCGYGCLLVAPIPP